MLLLLSNGGNAVEPSRAVALYQQFVHYHNQVLSAVDQEKAKIDRSAKMISTDFSAKREAQLQAHELDAHQRLTSNTKSLKDMLKRETAQTALILKAAEYLSVGHAVVKGIAADPDLPYILPFLGKNCLLVEGESNETDSILRTLILSTLEQTAAGQISLSVYNPDWREAFSCFTALDNFESATSTERFNKLLDSLSNQIDNTDMLLQGRFESLLELRRTAQQPTGQLRLVVLAGDDWLKDESIRKRVLRLLANGERAGIGFIAALPEKQMAAVKTVLDKAVLLQSAGKGYWKSSLIPNVLLQPAEWKPEHVSSLFSGMRQAIEESVAVAIPFDCIEDTEAPWTESSADGITFSLGKAGLETVTLRMGDQSTQLNNALITGAPGKGKSNLLEVMIHSLCCRYSPDELELYLLDFKDGLTFKPYGDVKQKTWMPHAAVLGLESARDFGVAVLEHIEAERTRRAKAMKTVNAGSLAQYRKKQPAARMPRIVIVIDEYQKLVELSDDTSKRAAELIENIVRQGRACGIHLILASQTVAHGGGLTEKDHAIYAAIPIRIALQNNIQESYATFVQGNDAAAKLRVRGEAVLNVNYGAPESNVRFTVAYAEPSHMSALRKRWCSTPLGSGRIPKSFGSDDCFTMPFALKKLQAWRQAVEENAVSPRILCGQQLSVDREIIGIPFGSDSGRHVAIFGNGDGEEDEPGMLPNNYAVGLLQGMAISLAVQHPDGNAFFTMIDGLTEPVRKKNNVSRWLSAMERLGFPVMIITPKEAPAFFAQIVEEAKSRDGTERHYILGMGMDRCSGMQEVFKAAGSQSSVSSLFGGGLTLAFREMGLESGDPVDELPKDDPFYGRLGTDDSNSASTIPVETTGAEQLENLLRIGPAAGIHFLGWWNNIKTFTDHTGYSGRDYIEVKILLRTGNNGARDVLGAFTAWEGMSNRLLLHDETTLQSDLVLLPLTPLSLLDVGKLEAMRW